VTRSDSSRSRAALRSRCFAAPAHETWGICQSRNPYVRRREDQRAARKAGKPYRPPLDHPLLAEALEETLGVILYQDQVLQVCQALAGFTAGQAEALRRAMSRRRSRELMEGFWDEFRVGAGARGVSEPTAKRVFEQVIAFSEFGFPKSHAAAFGLLAYQSAWLKQYHPVEYYVGLFNNQPMGFYSLDALGRDARRHGVEIVLPDINQSDVWCTVEQTDGRTDGQTDERAVSPRWGRSAATVGRTDGQADRQASSRWGHSDAQVAKRSPTFSSRPSASRSPHLERANAVRVGLGFVRDWGKEIAEEVVVEREKNGPYRSLGELVRRSPPKLSRLAIDNLVWVGGCDEFGLTRRELLWQAGLWLPPKTEQLDPARVRHQMELALNHPYEGLRFGDLAADERLLAEYGMLGFAPSGHPLSLLRGALPPGIISSARLPSLEHDSRVEVAGLVVARQRPHTAKGFVFVLMEDEAGMINAIVRPDIFDRDRIAVRGEPFLWIIGRLAKDDGSFNVIAEEVRPLKVPHRSPFPVPPSPAGPDSRSANPFAFLRSLRQNAPDSKDWG